MSKLQSLEKGQFPLFLWRITSAHVISYFIMGIIAASILDYQQLFASENLECLMKPMDSVWIASGPLFQIARGFVFAIALWIVKDAFLYQKNGWLKLWIVIACLCVFSPTGPAPGSIEGFVYTKVPFVDQVKGYLEVLPQTMLFSLTVYYWYKHPSNWWNITSIVLTIIICLLSVMGIIAHFYPM